MGLNPQPTFDGKHNPLIGGHVSGHQLAQRTDHALGVFGAEHLDPLSHQFILPFVPNHLIRCVANSVDPFRGAGRPIVNAKFGFQTVGVFTHFAFNVLPSHIRQIAHVKTDDPLRTVGFVVKIKIKQGFSHGGVLKDFCFGCFYEEHRSIPYDAALEHPSRQQMQ